MHPYEIEEIVSPEVFEKYEKFKLRSFRLEDEEGVLVFHCPGADCECFCIVDKDATQYKCPACEYECCPKCKEDSHEGSTCEEFKKWRLENSEAEKLFEQMLQKEGLMKCPVCGAPVERVSGC